MPDITRDSVEICLAQNPSNPFLVDLARSWLSLDDELNENQKALADWESHASSLEDELRDLREERDGAFASRRKVLT